MRGEIYLKAQAMKAAGRDVMYLNLGNPQSLGQKPFTFNRQVLALCVGGEALLGDEAVCAALPADVVARARELLKVRSLLSCGHHLSASASPVVITAHSRLLRELLYLFAAGRVVLQNP